MIEIDFNIIRDHVLLKMNNLAPELTYHSINHTLDVVKQSERIGADEGINNREHYFLKLAALYHDTGFLEVYKGHEEISCAIFLQDAAKWNLKSGDIDIIVELIMATKMPQKPKNLLQKIICDADLDYLGRSEYAEISTRLKKEFFNYGMVANEDEWEKLQLVFLENHQYHTKSSRLLREPGKRLNFTNLVKSEK